jgi:hypothetical protein
MLLLPLMPMLVPMLLVVFFPMLMSLLTLMRRLMLLLFMHLLIPVTPRFSHAAASGIVPRPAGDYHRLLRPPRPRPPATRDLTDAAPYNAATEADVSISDADSEADHAPLDEDHAAGHASALDPDPGPDNLVPPSLQADSGLTFHLPDELPNEFEGGATLLIPILVKLNVFSRPLAALGSAEHWTPRMLNALRTDLFDFTHRWTEALDAGRHVETSVRSSMQFSKGCISRPMP